MSRLSAFVGSYVVVTIEDDCGGDGVLLCRVMTHGCPSCYFLRADVMFHCALRSSRRVVLGQYARLRDVFGGDGKFGVAIGYVGSASWHFSIARKGLIARRLDVVGKNGAGCKLIWDAHVNQVENGALETFTDAQYVELSGLPLVIWDLTGGNPPATESIVKGLVRAGVAEMGVTEVMDDEDAIMNDAAFLSLLAEEGGLMPTTN